MECARLGAQWPALPDHHRQENRALCSLSLDAPGRRHRDVFRRPFRTAPNLSRESGYRDRRSTGERQASRGAISLLARQQGAWSGAIQERSALRRTRDLECTPDSEERSRRRRSYIQRHGDASGFWAMGPLVLRLTIRASCDLMVPGSFTTKTEEEESMRRIHVAVMTLAACAWLLTACNSGNKVPAKPSPQYSEAVSTFYIGLAALQVGDDVHADSALTQFTQLEEGETAGWANWGVLALRQRDYNAAARRLERAGKIAPQNSRIHYLQGLLESE